MPHPIDETDLARRVAAMSLKEKVALLTGGRGELTLGDEPLTIKAAKAMPSSD